MIAYSPTPLLPYSPTPLLPYSLEQINQKIPELIGTTIATQLDISKALK
ncbi:MAG: hypothetical protein AAGE84_24145 [Cyanobacteria bacterium P01_G01_bin.39]